MSWGTFEMGSLYLNGRPVSINSAYKSGPLSIGDTNPKKKLKWIKVNGLLIGHRTLCRGVGWRQLHEANLIYGHPIIIGGTHYFCRSLKDAKEWNDALTATIDFRGENPWFVDTKAFWAQQAHPSKEGIHCTVDCSGAPNYHHERFQLEGVGFRPVLEPLSPAVDLTRDLIGLEVRAYGPTGPIAGIVSDFSDYDLILASNCAVTNAHSACWVKPDGDFVIIDRAAISWLQREEG